MTTLLLPDFALVVLIAPSGDDTAAFAARHFHPDEVVGPGSGPGELPTLAEGRLRSRRLTVIDAGGLAGQTQRWALLARRCHAPAVAIVLDGGPAARPAGRAARLADPVPHLEREGFRIHRLGSPAAIGDASIERRPLRSDRRDDTGPFDIVGDVHGCADELEALLTRLGYTVRFCDSGGSLTCRVEPPAGRKAVFLGDLVDRGPRVADVLRLVMAMVADGTALCVVGNHDDKLLRWLDGRRVRVSHGLAQSIEQIDAESKAFREQVREFLNALTDHYWLDAGRLCVAHAGLEAGMIGRASGKVRSFALYGDTTGESDEFGLPVRLDWAARYRGSTRVVYGHTPVTGPAWRNNTICLDTGCVFGGALTALRYPEDELVSMPARRTYYAPVRPGDAGPARRT